MNNFFLNENEMKIEEKYDIKGSLYKRRLPKSKFGSGEAMKDENFIDNEVKLRISKHEGKALLHQVQMDAQFLSRQRVMDYSMLVGIVNNAEYENRISFKRRSLRISKQFCWNTQCFIFDIL